MTDPRVTREHTLALSRHSFAFFARGGMRCLLPDTPILWNWHLDLIAGRLEDAMEGRTRRLIINIPPRYGKSLMASVMLPAFVLGRRPSAEVVCASYAYDLAERMANDTRRLMNSRFYHDVFGPRLISPVARLGDLRTHQGGCRFATSVDGTMTGRGGNLIIIDDPLKPNQAGSETQRSAVNKWFDTTVSTRPNNKEKDAIIVIMQRLHEDDLVGHLLEQGHWEVLSLPVIAEEDEVHKICGPLGSYTWRRKPGDLLHPERESLARVRENERSLGPRDAAAQLQQRPTPAGGDLIRLDWFRTYDPARMPTFTQIIQSWDTASREHERADHSVCITMGETADGHYYLIDVYRDRIGFPALRKMVRDHAALHQVRTILVEDTSSGVPLIQDLRTEGFARIEAIRPQGSKFERMNARTPVLAAGRVWLPSQAHWLADFRHELEMFPNGRHDDQVDALSQALSWFADARSPARFLRMMDERIERYRRSQSSVWAV